MSTNVTDTLESLIIMSLQAHSATEGVNQAIGELYSGLQLFVTDQGSFLPFDPMVPVSSYTYDLHDSERLFTFDKNWLLAHPAEILGEQAEVTAFDEVNGVYKWRGFRRLKTKPKNVAYLGKATHWYEYHLRFVWLNGQSQYFKRCVPLDRDGNTLVAQTRGQLVCSPELEGEMVIACASVIEDAYRSDAMLATVKDATELKFPVPMADYKEVFLDRDGPYKNGKKSAIVHWVAQHLRKSKDGVKSVVKQHTRGVQEFCIDGVDIRLSPNPGYAKSLLKECAP